MSAQTKQVTPEQAALIRKFAPLDQPRFIRGDRDITARQWLNEIFSKGYTVLEEVKRGKFTEYDAWNPVKGDGYRIRRKLEAEYLLHLIAERDRQNTPAPAPRPAPRVTRDGYRITIEDEHGVLFAGVAEQVTDQGYTWFEIPADQYAKKTAAILQSAGYQIHEWEVSDSSVGLQGWIAFDWPHEEPDGTSPYMVENRRYVHLSDKRKDGARVFAVHHFSLYDEGIGGRTFGPDGNAAYLYLEQCIREGMIEVDYTRYSHLVDLFLVFRDSP